MRISPLVFALVALVASAASPAQIANWQGLASENWFNDVNWNPEAIPAAGSNVIINTVSPNPTTLAGAATPDLGAVQIGASATGDLLIELGGKLNNDGIGMLGTEAGSLGFVTIRNPGSEWRIDLNLVVGEQGAGSLRLRDGGYLLNNNGRIGNIASGSGAVSVWSGSNWVSLGNLFVAHSGTGSLDIRGDSGVFNQAQAFVGYAVSGDGSVRVREGGGWASFADVFIGREGQGWLDVESGGVVVVASDSNSFVGSGGLGTGEVTVTGTDSLWTSSGALIIGVNGHGQLEIGDGGVVEADIVSIGDLPTGVGTVTVGANSELTSDSNLIVGAVGTGALTIAGGEVSNANLGIIGNAADGSGEVILTGSGAYWFSQNDLIVGNNGQGVLTVSSGAEVESGGRVLIPSDLGDGTGLIELNGTLTASAANGGTRVRAGGTLTGFGTINGGLFVGPDGIVAPGAGPGSIGVLTVNGTLNLASAASILAFDLSNFAVPPDPVEPVSDRIEVNGDLILDGILEATVTGVFLPGIYTLITYTGTLSDQGLSIGSLPPPPPGYGAWVDTTSQPGEVRLVVGPVSDEVFSDRFEL